MLVAHEIPHLLGGVSQHPAALRSDSHVADLHNILLHPALGAVRRPPTQHRAAVGLTGDVQLYHEFRLKGTRYVLIVAGGALKVFNADSGAEVPVVFPEGTAYISDDPTAALRAATVGEMVVVANQGVTVKRSDETAPAKVHEALVVVRTGDYSTSYSVTLNGIKVTHTTPAATDTSVKAQITTTAVASELLTKLNAHSGLNDFTFANFGSVIHVRRTDGLPFSLATSDGQGDTALLAINGSVRSFTDLPSVAPEGMVVEVVGDPATGADNYFVRFEQGAWRECAEPGTYVALDPATMPWALRMGGEQTDLGQHQSVERPVVQDLSAGSGEFMTYRFEVTFPETQYPPGTYVTVFLDWNTYALTVTTETPEQLAAYFASQIDPHPDVTASASGRKLIIHEAHALAPGFWVGANARTLDHTFYNPQLRLVTNEYAGMTVRNVTSGATATVVSNTEATVVVDAWAGGSRQTLLPGDVLQLVDGEEGTFAFRPLRWRRREAGSEAIVPFPSFVGQTVDDVVYYQGRLGLLAGDSIVLSAAGDILRFFRKTATQLLPDDVIDVRRTSRDAARYHAAVPWRNGLYLFTTTGAYVLTGVPVLTPTTVRIDTAGVFASSPVVRPVAGGDTLFIPHDAHGYARLTEMLPAPGTDERPITTEVTDGIPTYIVGAPRLLVVDPSSSLLFVGTDGETDTLSVYAYRRLQDGSSAGAWGRWTFPGATVLAASASEGKLVVLLRRGTEVVLEEIDVAAPVRTPAWDYRDRQGLAGAEEDYISSIAFHPFEYRTRDGAVDTAGRLTLRYLRFTHAPGSVYRVGVHAVGRAESVVEVSGDVRAQVPVFARNTEAGIMVESVGAKPFALTSVAWEGTYTSWARQR